MHPGVNDNFFREAFALRGSITPVVARNVLIFGGIASAFSALAWLAETSFGIRLGLEVTPFEFAGAILGLLLVLRTNSGYDRWWEARKLWGGIVNQSRNLAISGLAYGPDDAQWRKQFVLWTAAFPHIARASLRSEPPPDEVITLFGEETAESIKTSPHMPSYVAMQLADMLQQAVQTGQIDRFAFLQLDRERATLIDHIGGCERILKTPLPLAYAIKIRRLIVMFLITLPFALLHRIGTDWLVPAITMLVAYPLLSLDQIGAELQNPFSRSNISHLPLGDISSTIEKNVLGMLSAKSSERPTAAMPNDQ